MKHSVSRRSLLVASSCIVTGGCLGEEQSSSDVILDAAEVRNLDDTGHTITCGIKRDSELVFEETVEVAAQSDEAESITLLSDTFTETEGTYYVHAALEDTDAEIDSKLHPVDSTCVKAEIRITTEQTLAVWVGESSGCKITEENMTS